MTRYTLATVPQAVEKYQRRMDFVLRYAVEGLIALAQTPKAKGGRMPVDTGFLRNSLLSELGGASGAIGPDSYVFIAGAMRAGTFATFRWTAEYAFFVNNGARGRAGVHFVEWAADQWQRLVNEGVQAALARYP